MKIATCEFPDMPNFVNQIIEKLKNPKNFEDFLGSVIAFKDLVLFLS